MRFWLAALPRQSVYAQTFAAALAIILLLATPCQSHAAVQEPKRVLMLHSFGPRFKPWSDYAQAIRSEISQQRQTPVDFLDHSLVNARESDENSEAAFVEYLRTLYDESADSILLSPSARPQPISSSAIVSGSFQRRQWSLPRWSSAGSSTRS